METTINATTGRNSPPEEKLAVISDRVLLQKHGYRGDSITFDGSMGMAVTVDYKVLPKQDHHRITGVLTFL